jgi:hypothetical protein
MLGVIDAFILALSIPIAQAIQMSGPFYGINYLEQILCYTLDRSADSCTGNFEKFFARAFPLMEKA